VHHENPLQGYNQGQMQNPPQGQGQNEMHIPPQNNEGQAQNEIQKPPQGLGQNELHIPPQNNEGQAQNEMQNPPQINEGQDDFDWEHFNNMQQHFIQLQHEQNQQIHNGYIDDPPEMNEPIPIDTPNYAAHRNSRKTSSFKRPRETRHITT
jgi:hypothetical protein